jgi:hypothetical protein
MTLLDIQNQIVNHFSSSSSSFSLAANLAAIKVPATFSEHKAAMVKAVMAELEKMGMVKPLDAETWILTSPLGSNGQQIEISYALSNAIAEEIKAYADANDLEWTVDPLNLHEGNFLMLLAIINDLRSDDPEGDES